MHAGHPHLFHDIPTMYSAGYQFGVPAGILSDSIASLYSIDLEPRIKTMLDYIFQPEKQSIVYNDLNNPDALKQKQGRQKLLFAADNFFLTLKSCDFYFLNDLEFPSATSTPRYWPSEFFNTQISFVIRRELTAQKLVLEQIAQRFLQTGNLIGSILKHAPEVAASDRIHTYCQEKKKAHIRSYPYEEYAANFGDFISIFLLWFIGLISCAGVFIAEGCGTLFMTGTVVPGNVGDLVTNDGYSEDLKDDDDLGFPRRRFSL